MPIQFEANIDDMDPRLWPTVIESLLAAGALDAWATPILMKKGRPAFTLGVLCEPTDFDEVHATIFRETTTIGARYFEVDRVVLPRTLDKLNVEGQPIGRKRSYLAAPQSGDAGSDDGKGNVEQDVVGDAGHDRAGSEPVNTSVEWDDVVAAANALGMSAKDVLAAATAAAHQQTSD